MDELRIPRSCGTHDGTFHADDVSACALLILFDLIDENNIVRTRDPALLNRCEYVCDVGGFYDPARKQFDHHQLEYKGALSSAGMVLLYLKEEGKLSLSEYEFLKNNLMSKVDAYDNGQELEESGFNSYSDVIANFTPIRYDASAKEYDQAFHEALHFALDHLSRFRVRYEYYQSCRQVVQEAMKQNKQWLLFERKIPWMESFFELGGETHPALFIIMPSEGHWILRGIPPSNREKMQVRFPMPKAWAGLLDEELQKQTGIPGAIFCHKGRFISAWKSKEAALQALNLILSEKYQHDNTVQQNCR